MINYSGGPGPIALPGPLPAPPYSRNPWARAPFRRRSTGTPTIMVLYAASLLDPPVGPVGR